MKSSLLFVCVVILLTGSIFLFPGTARGAFGVSPPAFGTTHLLKGSYYSQDIYLVQDKPDQDLGVTVQLDVPEKIRGWFTVNDGKEIVIPKGDQQYPLKIAIQVPQDAELGVYGGYLRIATAPAQTGQVTIALGAEIAINLTIGNDIYRNLAVPVIKFYDIEEGWAPQVYVKMNNQGNIAEAFDYATFELQDQFGAVRLAYVTKDKDFPEVSPFTVKEFVIEFPTNFYIGIGQYWGSVSFYQGGKVFVSQRTVFTVVSAGTLSGFWGLARTFMKKYLAYEIAGGILVLMMLIFMWKRMRTKKFRMAH